MVARALWEREVAGSSPVTPTRKGSVQGSVQKWALIHWKNIGNSISDFLVNDSDVLPFK